MTKIQPPKTIKRTDETAILDVGDRLVIIKKLIPISGMRGFVACEKLHNDRLFERTGEGNPDVRSIWPARPTVLKETGNGMIMPSIEWGIDYVIGRCQILTEA